MSFLEELGRKASETCKNTAEKTNRLTKEMKIKSMINDDKNKIEKLYAEIGKKVFDNLSILEENYKHSIDDECEKIRELSKEIDNMNLDLLALKNMKKCSNCYAEINLSAKYCPACGCVQENNEPVNNTQENNENKQEEQTVSSNEMLVAQNTSENNNSNENNNNNL